MKRIISFLLALVLTISLFGVADFRVFAAGNDVAEEKIPQRGIETNTVIEELTVSIKEPEIGMPISQLTATAQENASLYEIIVFDGYNGDVLTEGTFQEGYLYDISYEFVPDEGYEFAEWIYISVDTDYSYSWGNSANSASFSYEFQIGGQEISTIDLTVPEIAVGMSTDDCQIVAPEDAPFLITGWTWYNITQGSYDPEFFEKDNRYWFTIHFKPNRGYTFGNDVQLYINGELANVNYVVDGIQITGEKVYSLAENEQTVSYAEVQVDGVVAGGNVEDVKITLPEDAPYEIAGFVIQDAETYDVIHEGTFDKNRSYYVFVNLAAKPGAVFADDMQICINGVVQNVWVYEYNQNAEVSQIFSFGVGQIQLGYMPDYIQPGEAEVPWIDNYGTQVSISSVKWLDASKAQEVTAFEDGYAYYLALELTANDGREFPENWEPNIEFDNYYPYEWVKNDEKTVTLYFRYSLEPTVDEIFVSLTQAEIGMNVGDLHISIDGNAQLVACEVFNYTQDMIVKDGILEQGNTYRILYKLSAAEGYQFSREVYVGHEGPQALRWETDGTYLYVYYDYAACEIIPTVEINATMPMPGASAGDCTVTIPDGVLYQIESWSWQNAYTGEPAEGVFEAGNEYVLVVWLTSADGYAFASNGTQVLLNGKEQDGYVYQAGLEMEINKLHSFFVNEASVCDLPSEIQPGTAKVPQVELDYGEVSISKVTWVDSTKKNTVTTFKDGNVYYLAVTLKANAGKVFRTEGSFYLGSWHGSTHDITFLSESEAVAYFRYSLEPDVGKVLVTPVPMYEGMKVSDITATVNGNVILQEVAVIDISNKWEQENESLKPLTNYMIRYMFVPKDGYRFAGNTEFEVNNYKRFDCYGGDDYRVVEIYFSTCRPIEKVSLTVEGVEIGSNIADVQVILPENANYEVTLEWHDVSNGWDEATGQFQDGHKYELGINMVSKEGYIFTEDTEFFFNGKKVEISINIEGTSCTHWEVYSYLDPIVRVDIPAIPTSIKLGQTLPTNFQVSADALYTLEAQWGIMSEGTVTKVEKNASYLLAFLISAKPGYEFTEETKVYCNGKEVTNFMASGGSDLMVYNLYNVGMNEIDRIELTVPVLEAGKTPGEFKVSSTAKYTVEGADWGYNTDGSLLNINSFTTFEKGMHIFVAPTLVAKEGYVFAPDVAVYINGEKMTTLRIVNVGQMMMSYYYLGVVGDQINPLTAPVITVAGTTITWNADPAAQSYEVYRSTGKTGKYSLVATVTEAQYVDTAAAVGKTYYYKVKAISGAGAKYNSGYSNVATVIYTCAAPEIHAGTDAATGKTVITWDKVSGAKKYEVWRATAVDGTYTRVTTVTGTSYTDSKAAVGVEYYYKVKAIAGTSTYNSGFSGIYMSYAACARPVVKATVDAATGKPTLSWSKITSATGYRIYRKLPTDADFVVIAEQTGVSFLDTTAPLDTECQYIVQAIGADPSCDSAYSQILSASVALGIPTVKTSLDDGKPVLTWQAVEGAVKYEIYRSTTSYSKGYTLYATVETTSFTDVNVSAGKTYYYKVVASGEVSKSKESTYAKVTAICGTPTLEAQIDAASGKPSLSWDAQAGAKNYEVYRSVNGAAYKKVATVKTATYIDKSAPIGSVCDYKVRAVGSKSTYNSPYSNVEGCMVICSAPAVKATVDTATGKPSLRWSKTTGAVAYRIFRMLPGEEDFVMIAEITGTSYLDKSAPIDTECVYRLITVGKEEGLNSAFTGLIEVTSSIAQPKVTTALDDGKPVLTWQAVEGAVKYEIYRSTTSYSKGYTLYATVETTSFTDVNVSAGKTYYYKVVASGEVSKSKESTYAKVTAICGTPTLEAQIDAASGKPSLSWDAQAGAKSYEVYRSVNGAAYKKVATVKTITYIDKSAPIGSVCNYKVRAVGSKSTYNSPYSNVEGCMVICSAPAVKATVDTATGKPSLRWSKTTGAVAYRIFRMLPGEEDFVMIAEITGTSYLDKSAPIDTECVYRLITVGKEEGLNSAFTGLIELTSTVGRPKVGTDPAYRGKPYIYWNKIDGAVAYEIYRSTSATKGFTLLTTVQNQTRFTDESAPVGKTYYYKIVALGIVSKSADSNVVKQASACNVPQITVAIDLLTGKPKITWEKVEGAKSYEIYRSTEENSLNPTRIGTSKTDTYLDKTAKVGVTYYYTVKAIGSSSTYSSMREMASYGAIPALAQPVVTVKTNNNGEPVLTWKKVTDAGKYIVIYMNEEMANSGQYMYETVTTTTFTLKGKNPGELYGFSVIAVPKKETLADTCSSYSDPVYCYVTLPAPKLTSVTLSAEGKPMLRWESGSASGQIWVIYRATSANGKYEEIGACTDPNGCIDTSAVKGKTYYYKIAAVYGDSISPLSNYKYVKSK